MVNGTAAFSGFSVRDIDETEVFYRDVLGVPTARNDMGILELTIGDGATVIAYAKGDDHIPATFTILNFPVDDVEAAVDELTGKGVVFLRYDGAPHDEKGIVRGWGPTIAWFADPSGNVLSVLEG